MRRPTVSLASLLLVGLLAGPAAADDSDDDERGWQPKRYSTSELIDFGTRSDSPLQFPWTVVRTEQVTNYGRIDFRHLVEADFGTVEAHFEQKYREQDPALELDSTAVPPGASPELNVLGTASQGEARTFTLGNGDLRRTFVIQVRPASDAERTAIVFQNMALRHIFSAGLPRLAPLKPIDADPIQIGR